MVDTDERVYRDSLLTDLTDLAEFVQNHRPHGALTADATEPAWWNGYLLTFACLCDATLKRWGTLDEADRDLTSWSAVGSPAETRRCLTPVCLGSTIPDIVR